MREIKFRGKRKDNGEWVIGNLSIEFDGACHISFWASELTDASVNLWEPVEKFHEVTPETVGQYTGLKDKNGKEIYEGGIILIRKPYRSTQTHEGDNIPLGSYTEPLEPAISEDIECVVFDNGTFTCGDKDGESGQFPLGWEAIQYDLATMKEGFGGGWVQYRENSRWAWGGEDGDLQYLLETYQLKTEIDLLNYVGIEVIGNIHDNQELVNPALKEGVNIDMNILDPGTQSQQATGEVPANNEAANAQESAAQDQATGATESAEEGTIEG